MMKTKTFSLILGLSFTLVAQAADSNSQTLMELLKDDKVNAAYNECKEVDKVSTDGLDDCVWGKLDDAKKEEVKKKMALSKQGSSGSKEEKAKYDSLNLGSHIKASDSKKKDPEIKKLEEFLSKRLSDSLYGDITSQQQKSNPTKVVDHKVFYELYESQVSKSVLSALSSYCVIANPDDKFYIEKDKSAQKAQREKNIADLKNFSQDKSKEGTPENLSSSKWLECSSSIQKICAKEAPYDSVTEDKEKEKLEYSQKQACVVTKMIKDARQTLLKVAEIKKVMNEGENTKGVSLQGSKNVEVYAGTANPATKSKNIDELTSISSAEFSKSGYDEGVKEKQELLKRCKESSTTEDPACQGILLNEKEAEASRKALDEYDLRTKVLEEKIKDPSKVTKEDVSDYLKEQGYSEDQIKEMIEKDIEKLKEQIANRYAQEREAIVKKLNEKLKSKTIDTSAEDVKAAKETKIDELASELEGKPEELKQLIHYNNIVTGFLKIAEQDAGDKKKDKNSKQEDNTISIARELESTEGLTPEEIKKQEELKKVMQEQGVKLDAKNTDRSGTNITVDDINKNLLKYDAATGSETTPTP